QTPCSCTLDRNDHPIYPLVYGQIPPTLISKHRCRTLKSQSFLGATPIKAFLLVCQHHAGPSVASPIFFSVLRRLPSTPFLHRRPVDCVCIVLRVLVVAAFDSNAQSHDYAINIDLAPTVIDVSRSSVPVRILRIKYFLPTSYTPSRTILRISTSWI
ncbi:hypothetical protein M405DRAFT_939065, partial [Rhizopogon salebrosus TDB-379]